MQTLKSNFIFLFLWIEFFLFISFLILDSFFPSFSLISNLLKYTAIWLIFFIGRKEGNRKFQYARMLTLVCDFLLLFTPWFLTGILLFCVVQFCYLSALFCIKKRKGIFYTFFPFPLLLSVFVYGSLLFCNIILSGNFVLKRNSTRNFFLFFGFLLFALCDCSIAIYHLTGLSFVYPFVWLFYIPSQILLVFSDCNAFWEPKEWQLPQR